MSIGVDELKIFLYTNLVDEKYEKIEFKREMLYQANYKESGIRLNSFPFYTSDVKYPESKLKTLSYSELIDFFFNEKTFIKILSNDRTVDNEYTSNFNKKHNEIIDHNIGCMLKLLFPTSFPTANDHHNSYDLIHGKNSSGGLFSFFESSGKFSYLKINNKTYTVKKVVWINDLINHPDYSNLLESAHKLSDNVINMQKETKDLQMLNIQDMYDIIDTAIDKLLEGINVSINRVTDLTKKIEMGRYTETYVGYLFTLHLLLHVILGNTKDSYRDKITSQLIDKLDNKQAIPIKQQIDQIISDAVRNQQLSDFKIYQDAIISARVCSDSRIKLDSFIKNSLGNPNDVRDKVVEFKEIMAKACSKKVDIQKEYDKYKVLDEIINGKPSKYEYSKNPSTKVEYEKFNRVLRYYTSPARTSSNLFLQNIINPKDEKSSVLLDFLNKVDSYYIENNNEKLNSKEEELLDVGVSRINRNNTNSPSYEICVMVDFFDGELTAENKGKIYCPYTNEYLGDELEKLMEGSPKRNLLWTLDNERKIFSLDKISVENSEKTGHKKNMELREVQRDIPTNTEDNNTRREENRKQDDTELYIWLMHDIITDDLIKSALDKVNTLTVPKSWSKEELLEFLVKYNRELYNEINNVFSNKDKYTKKSEIAKTQVTLLGLNGKYKVKIEQNDVLLKSSSLNNPGREEEKNKIILDSELQRLYLILVGYLVAYIDKLSKTKGGRKRKQRTQKKRFNKLARSIKRLA